MQIFFEELCTDKHRAALIRGIKVDQPDQHSTVRPIVDALYDVRCDVVHEGMYFGFDMREDPDDVDRLCRVGEQTVIVSMLQTELRQLLLEGAVEAVRTRLPAVASNDGAA